MTLPPQKKKNKWNEKERNTSKNSFQHPRWLSEFFSARRPTRKSIKLLNFWFLFSFLFFFFSSHTYTHTHTHNVLCFFRFECSAAILIPGAFHPRRSTQDREKRTPLFPAFSCSTPANNTPRSIARFDSTFFTLICSLFYPSFCSFLFCFFLFPPSATPSPARRGSSLHLIAARVFSNTRLFAISSTPPPVRIQRTFAETRAESWDPPGAQEAQSTWFIVHRPFDPSKSRCREGGFQVVLLPRGAFVSSNTRSGPGLTSHED